MEPWRKLVTSDVCGHLDQEEAAKYLRLSIRMLENLRQRGDGPSYFKIGRRVVYAKERLDAWLARHAVHSTAEARELGCTQGGSGA
jgi:Helix-turn-helix domain